ncbi:uncharacterized protein [Typha angustifolia]|uniref:uncharacterized protein n=1 Tax=Typha angustifolia TaxID=59011 RepID=UPI003C2E713F
MMKDFSSWIDKAGLMDLGFAGPAFTWSNRRSPCSLSRERLDRVLACPRWSSFFPEARVLHLPAILSDHNPVLLETLPVIRRGKLRFRFESWWLKEESFLPHCSSSWRAAYRPHNSLSSNLLELTRKIRTWAAKHSNNFRTNIKKVEAEILKVQTNGSTHAEWAWESTLRCIHEDLLLKEEIHWHQRSRVSWLRWGDRNTSFFHSSATARKRCNRISTLRLPTDDWTRSEQVIKTAFVQHFK